MKKISLLLILGTAPLLVVSCSQMKDDDNKRVPVPPQGTSRSTIPWNKTQKFEGDAALGPFTQQPR